jgi:hypothetical protein
MQKNVVKQENRQPTHIDLSKVVPGIPPKATEFCHAKCYAAPLSSCSSKISREHYLSANILELFECLDTDHIPFLKGGVPKRIDPMCLNAKILCTTHNEYLSPLDTVAGELFRFLLTFPSDNWKTMTINGFALEK